MPRRFRAWSPYAAPGLIVRSPQPHSMIDLKADSKVARFLIENPRWFQLGAFGQAWFGRDATSNRKLFVKVLQPYERVPQPEEMDPRVLEGDQFCAYSTSEDVIDGQELPVLSRNTFRPGLPIWPRKSVDEIKQQWHHPLEDLVEQVLAHDQRTWRDWHADFDAIVELALAAQQASDPLSTLIAPANFYLEDAGESSSEDDNPVSPPAKLLMQDVGISYDPTGFAATTSFDETAMEGLPYLPPEAIQALKEGRERDPSEIRADRELVYQIAMTFAALIMRRVPFDCASATELVRTNGQRRELQLESIINQRILAAFERATDPNPEARFASVHEFQAALREVPDWEVRDPRPKSFYYTVFGSAGAAVLAIVIFLAMYFSATASFGRSDDLAKLSASPIEDYPAFKKQLRTEWGESLGDYWLYVGQMAALDFDFAKLDGSGAGEIASQLRRAEQLAKDEGEVAAVAQLQAWQFFLSKAYGTTAPTDMSAAQGAPAGAEAAATAMAAKLLGGDKSVTLQQVRKALESSQPGPLGAQLDAKSRWQVAHLVALCAQQAGPLGGGDRHAQWFAAAVSRNDRAGISSDEWRGPQDPASWRAYADLGVGSRTREQLGRVVVGSHGADWRKVLGEAVFTDLVVAYLDALERYAATSPEAYGELAGHLDAIETGRFVKSGVDRSRLDVAARRSRLVRAELPALLARGGGATDESRLSEAYDRAKSWLDSGADKDPADVAAIRQSLFGFVWQEPRRSRHAADAVRFWAVLEDPRGELLRAVELGAKTSKEQNQYAAGDKAADLFWCMEQREAAASGSAKLDWLWTMRELWSERKWEGDPQPVPDRIESGFRAELFSRWVNDTDEAKVDPAHPLFKYLDIDALVASENAEADAARYALASAIESTRAEDALRLLIANGDDDEQSIGLRLRIRARDLRDEGGDHRQQVEVIIALLKLRRLIDEPAADPDAAPIPTEAQLLEMLGRRAVAWSNSEAFDVPKADDESAAIGGDIAVALPQLLQSLGENLRLETLLGWNGADVEDSDRALLRLRLSWSDEQRAAAKSFLLAHFQAPSVESLRDQEDADFVAKVMATAKPSQEASKKKLRKFLAWLIYSDANADDILAVDVASRLDPDEPVWVNKWLRHAIAPGFLKHPYNRPYQMELNESKVSFQEQQELVRRTLLRLETSDGGGGGGDLGRSEYLWHRGFLAMSYAVMNSDESVQAKYLPIAFSSLSELAGILEDGETLDEADFTALGLLERFPDAVNEEDRRRAAWLVCVNAYRARVLLFNHRAKLVDADGEEFESQSAARARSQELANLARETATDVLKMGPEFITHLNRVTGTNN